MDTLIFHTELTFPQTGVVQLMKHLHSTQQEVKMFLGMYKKCSVIICFALMTVFGHKDFRFS